MRTVLIRPSNPTGSAYLTKWSFLPVLIGLLQLAGCLLTMSYTLLFGTARPAYVEKEFRSLLARINRARNGKKAKVIVGGPGVWELTLHPDEMDKNKIDYAFQGESEDVVDDLFRYVLDDSSRSSEFFREFQTFDSTFHKSWVSDERFITCERENPRIHS